MKIVTVFAQPFERATGYVMLDNNGRYCWKIGGVGIGGETPATLCPFDIPHGDFAAAIASAYFNAIAATIGGGEYGAERALDMLFNYKREPKA